MASEGDSVTLESSQNTIDTADDQPRSKRRRDLLKHYGIQKTPADVTESRQTLKKLEPFDISNVTSFSYSKIVKIIIPNSH
jgi:hypothetical protein